MKLNCDHPYHHFTVTGRELDFLTRENVPPITHCHCGQMILIPDDSQPAGSPPVTPVPADGPAADVYRKLLADEFPDPVRDRKPHLEIRKRRKVRRQAKRQARK